jgi:FtsP/CotA-like multicopper oxidase with cupredoxin domain
VTTTSQTITTTATRDHRLPFAGGHPIEHNVIQLEHVKGWDRDGNIKRNLVDPPLKDTVMVPDVGFVVIRFLADNPGYWMFHCHVDWHLNNGMALIIKV